MTETAPKREASRRGLTLLAMCISQGMILLDITIVNIALPSIQHELKMSPGRLEWVISAYALSLAGLIPFGGTLGDRYGRKKVFLVGLVVFTTGTVACALAPTDLSLISARVVQGMGGAVMSALTLSILTEAFPAEGRAAAIGTWAAVAGLGFGAGPVVGGLLLSAFGWSSIFWVNVPLAGAGLVMTILFVSDSKDPVPRRLDLVGVATSAGGLLGVTYGLIEASSHPWGSTEVLAPLLVGVLLLAAFALHERRATSPMAPPALLGARSFVVGCGVYAFVYLALAGVMFYATLLFQDVKGWSALHTGLSWLFMNTPFLVMAQLAGRLNRRFPGRVVVSSGCLVAAVGIVMLGLVTPSSPFVVAAIGYVLLGSGYGTLIPGITNVAMRDVPEGVSGAASGLLNACRQVGTSVGLAVLGSVGIHVATGSWSGYTNQLSPGTRHQAAHQAQAVAGGQIASVGDALGRAARDAAAYAFTQGYRTALLVGGGAVLIAAGLVASGLRRKSVLEEEPIELPAASKAEA